MRVWPLKDTGGVMDIQKERKAFEKALVDKCGFNPESSFSVDDKGEYKSDATHFGWAMWQAAKAQAVPEGFVLVPEDQFESLNEFKGLYKRAIINARKRKDQLNWAHVAGLGVGSGRAVELCKMLNIDPCATNMHEVIEAQEQSHD